MVSQGWGLGPSQGTCLTPSHAAARATQGTAARQADRALRWRANSGARLKGKSLREPKWEPTANRTDRGIFFSPINITARSENWGKSGYRWKGRKEVKSSRWGIRAPKGPISQLEVLEVGGWARGRSLIGRPLRWPIEVKGLRMGVSWTQSEWEWVVGHSELGGAE